VSLLSSGVLLALAGRVPFAAANAAVTVASTLLATELHHRFTFGAGKGPAGWRVHAQSALTLALAYLVTTAAVLALPAVHPHPSPLLTQAVYLTASAFTGTARFLALRLLVFAHRPPRAARTPGTLDRATVTTAA
jgi:putative flippase GtrA